MPKVSQITNLKNICFRNISSNLDKFYCKFYEPILKERNYVFIFGPFDILPTFLSQELWVYLKDHHHLKFYQIHLLIRPLFESIDYSGAKSEISLVLKLAKSRCWKLKTLNLNRIKAAIPKTPFEDCLQGLPSLSSLNLSEAKGFNDQYMKYICKHCPNLLHLDISYSQVSDTGFSGLYASSDYGCKALKYLNIEYTKVSVPSATQALEILKFLVSFIYQDSLVCVAQCSSRTAFPFNALYSTSTGGATDELFLLGIQRCLQLERLEIDLNNDLTEESLSNLVSSSVGNLKTLMITNIEGWALFPLWRSLNPILKKFPLHILTLTDSCGIDLAPVIQLLWLKELHLYNNISYILTSKVDSIELVPQLRVFNFKGHEEDRNHSSEHFYPPDNQLEVIFNAPLLNVLELNNLSCLKSNLFKSMESLTHLELSECPKIELENELYDYLYSKNSLETLKLLNCKLISLRNFNNLKKFYSSKKWNVQLEYA